MRGEIVYTACLAVYPKSKIRRLDDSRIRERTFSRMIKVKARGNESIEQMLRRFKKMCEKEGLTKEIKRTSYYEKPSERRRRRIRKAVKRAEKTFFTR